MTSAAVFKGGSQSQLMISDVDLHFGARVYVLAAQFDNLGVRLPSSKHLRAGGPHFFVVNSSAAREIKVRDKLGPQEFATIPAQAVATICFVGSDPQLQESWVIDVKPAVIGAAQQIAATPFSLSVGPGLLSNVNLRDAFVAQYPNALTIPVDLTVTIRPNTVIRSSSTALPALDTGSFPAGSSMKIINKGTIQGSGGDGGVPGTNAAASRGGSGGHAIRLQLLTDLDNSDGLIFGGGGGGGALFDASPATVSTFGFGGGGSGGVPGTGNPSAGAGFSPSTALANHVARDGSEFFPGFGAPGASVPRMFSETSGGMGGFPGMPGEDIGGLLGANSVSGAPGLAIDGGQFVNSIDPGVIQGALINPAGSTATIYVSTIASSFNASDYLKQIGWDGVTPIDLTIIIADGATVFSPRRYRTDTLTVAGIRELLIEAAIDTGSFPSGSTITIENNGSVFGYGGWGGRGRTPTLAPTNGHDGGAALKIRANTTINNNGSIIGGGGGGGGASDAGSGLEGGAGGAGMGAPPIPPFWPEPSSVNLTSGLLVDRDARRLDPATDFPTFSEVASRDGRWLTSVDEPGEGTRGVNGTVGGSGGTHGASGQPGGGITSSPGAAGGSAGSAIEGISNATIVNNGEIIGAQLP